MSQEKKYRKLTLTQLEQLAIERFGSLQSASLMAQRECGVNESILRNKNPWIKALLKPLTLLCGKSPYAA